MMKQNEVIKVVIWKFPRDTQSSLNEYYNFILKPIGYTVLWIIGIVLTPILILSWLSDLEREVKYFQKTKTNNITQKRKRSVPKR